jgi:Cu-Zn family superoxide dismutase
MTKLFGINFGMRGAAVALVGVACGLGALTYGCSDDDEPVDPGTKVDAGNTDAKIDTGTPVDKDTGAGDTGSADTGADTGTTATASVTIAATRPDGGASGSASFVESSGGVAVSLTIDGPPGLHGVHIHETGDCGDGGLAAGNHWNPTDAGHGLPDAATHHAGDFGNLSLDDAGHGTLSLTVSGITIDDGGTSIVGHAIIVHANPDDGTPGDAGPGNSGARLGCGVITRTTN